MLSRTLVTLHGQTTVALEQLCILASPSRMVQDRACSVQRAKLRVIVDILSIGTVPPGSFNSGGVTV